MLLPTGRTSCFSPEYQDHDDDNEVVQGKVNHADRVHCSAEFYKIHLRGVIRQQ